MAEDCFSLSSGGIALEGCAFSTPANVLHGTTLAGLGVLELGILPCWPWAKKSRPKRKPQPYDVTEAEMKKQLLIAQLILMLMGMKDMTRAEIVELVKKIGEMLGTKPPTRAGAKDAKEGAVALGEAIKGAGGTKALDPEGVAQLRELWDNWFVTKLREEIRTWTHDFGADWDLELMASEDPKIATQLLRLMLNKRLPITDQPINVLELVDELGTLMLTGLFSDKDNHGQDDPYKKLFDLLATDPPGGTPSSENLDAAVKILAEKLGWRE